MAEKRSKLTLDEAKQVIEDLLMFLIIETGRPLWIDFSKYHPKDIIELAESLPEELINYSKTLDASITDMEKRINKIIKSEP